MATNRSINIQDAAVPHSVGDILRVRRKELGLTQYHIAERANVPQGTVSRWETGDLKRTKEADRLIDIARAYEIHPSLLLAVGYYENHEIPLLPKETLRALAQLSAEQIDAVTVFVGFLIKERLDNGSWT